MSMLEEANTRRVVAVLEMLSEGIRSMIEKAKKGELREVPHEGLLEMDFPAKGFSSAVFGENTAIFRVCHSELLDFMREKRESVHL